MTDDGGHRKSGARAMGMLEVDYIIGRIEPEINGVYRYALELMSRCEGAVDGRLIAYNPADHPRFAGRLPALTCYPLQVARRKRTGSVKHVCSHIQAHLLHYLDLKPCVVTCHDIYPFRRKGYPLIDRGMVETGVRGMLKAGRLIASSEFTKWEILARTSYPEERIDVIHLGVDGRRFRPLDEAAVATPWPFPEWKRVILYVGSEQPRKNLAVLLRAISLAARECKDVLFVKVGRPQWKGAREELERNIRELNLEGLVLFRDYVPEDELPLLYNRADVFVFPSLYEGFGLPPLEAMACGCPVVAANSSSLPEVVGDAGILVAPEDEEEMAAAICRVLGDEELHAELSRRGLQRASLFTWEETARKTLGTYRKAIEDG